MICGDDEVGGAQCLYGAPSFWPMVLDSRQRVVAEMSVQFSNRSYAADYAKPYLLSSRNHSLIITASFSQGKPLLAMSRTYSLKMLRSV